ncbi:MAG: hypothetical protein H7Z16_15050 [Pyrinomonadaceae bacterium]|nr:hypothetical protein [Pyrinomonadaceae bacterium]
MSLSVESTLIHPGSESLWAQFLLTPLIELRDTFVKLSYRSTPRINFSIGCEVWRELAGAGIGSGSAVGVGTDFDPGARLPDCAWAVDKQLRAKPIARVVARVRRSFDLLDMLGLSCRTNNRVWICGWEAIHCNTGWPIQGRCLVNSVESLAV